MRRFFQTLGLQSDGEETVVQAAPTNSWEVSRIYPVRQQDLMKFRKHRGVNLGAWFVLERWITDTPYRDAVSPGQSDLDVAKGKNAKANLEKHWDTWITTKDWDWLVQAGINSVRIPIGYYHACGADQSILDGTDFYPYYSVYEGAWKRITAAIVEANKRNITVLIDVHAAPGKQNNDAHSGTSNKANFFNDPHNLRRGTYALESIARNLSAFTKTSDPPLDNIIGLELVNEPSPPSDSALMSWYTTTIQAVQKVHPDIPIYLGEFWRPSVYADYVSTELLNSANPESLIVLDHHLYRCFTDSDVRTSVQDHTKALRATSGGTPEVFEQVSDKMGRAGGGLIVGEWSGGLNPASLRNVQYERRDFVQAQLDLYERTCAGWYFWTYKKEYTGDVGWSLREAVENGVFPATVGAFRKRGIDDFQQECARRMAALDKAINTALAAHTRYWARTPGNYDHQQFAHGFNQGWNTSYRFFETLAFDSAQVSEPGFKHALAYRCSINHDSNYWEYETGFLEACAAAKKDFQLTFC